MVKAWLFMSTEDYSHIHHLINTNDHESIQCDTNPMACLGNKENFLHHVSSLYGAMLGLDSNGEPTWSKEGQMILGEWHGLVRYAIKGGETYLGYHTEHGLNGKMI